MNGLLGYTVPMVGLTAISNDGRYRGIIVKTSEVSEEYRFAHVIGREKPYSKVFLFVYHNEREFEFRAIGNGEYTIIGVNEDTHVHERHIRRRDGQNWNIWQINGKMYTPSNARGDAMEYLDHEYIYQEASVESRGNWTGEIRRIKAKNKLPHLFQ